MKIVEGYKEGMASGNGFFPETENQGEANHAQSHDQLYIHRFKNRILKRSIDIILSVLVICLVFPWLLPLLCILILFDQGYPVFFVQDRVGLNNRLFRCFKLRTMGSTTNVSKGRVSRLGKFLRTYKLDEIPQFFNVLRGEMSVVGPRPHTISDHHVFHNLIGEVYDQRHKVKPGITGLAQVSGYEGKISSLDKLRGRILLDLFYIRNWSIRLENQIIYRTLGVILRGHYRKKRILDKYAIDAISKKEMNDDPIKWKQKRQILKELQSDG